MALSEADRDDVQSRSPVIENLCKATIHKDPEPHASLEISVLITDGILGKELLSLTQDAELRFTVY